jgi:hypothetical protein
MKMRTIFAVLAIFFACGAFAQSGQDMQAIEAQMMMPKRGMEDKFEAAVLAHNKKFHPDGPYAAALRKIEYGPKTGWYVWVMGPVPFTSLDTRPTKENGHQEDWDKNIDPLVESYGPTNLMGYHPELSYGLDLFKKAKHYELWMVDLKDGQYYRFKALCEKLRKVYESMGNTAFLVMDNQLHEQKGTDVALIWSFNSYSDWQKDPGPKAAYEKAYGEGTWDLMIRDWMDIINGYTSEIRSNVFGN